MKFPIKVTFAEEILKGSFIFCVVLASLLFILLYFRLLESPK